ncbi:YigZ family protein [Desulfallas thermosapovorans]|uniref:YigZ family protein n=1 Tax=Desulfallas thermosapovorans TaxID=58137 RepID=UPI001413181C|nr:YigZ family protein [Desulfallas thermosapovorans]
MKLPNLTHMKNSYQTINKPVVVETIIKKSRFITSASPVKDAEEAGRFLSTIRERHSQANHNVFAYVIDERIQRYSDDGEPGGTAGKPVLDLIKQKSLTRIIIVVTRYFGGIMLGAGGLVRAYREAALKGIETAGVVTRQLYRELCITIDYNWLGIVKKELEKTNTKQMEMTYGQEVMIKVYLEPGNINSVAKQILEVTGGQAVLAEGGFCYL